jgi:hypothetical protein
MSNRAMEFLQEAERIMTSLNYTRKDAIFTLVQLARGEVQELLDQLAALETQTTPTPTHSGGVLIVEAQPMTPARLSESPRPALGVQQRKALPGRQ